MITRYKKPLWIVAILGLAVFIAISLVPAFDSSVIMVSLVLLGGMAGFIITGHNIYRKHKSTISKYILGGRIK